MTALVGDSPVSWDEYKHRVFQRQAFPPRPTRSRMNADGKTVDEWSIFYLTLAMHAPDHVRSYMKSNPDQIKALLKHHPGYSPPPLHKIPMYIYRIERQAMGETVFMDEDYENPHERKSRRGPPQSHKKKKSDAHPVSQIQATKHTGHTKHKKSAKAIRRKKQFRYDRS